MTEKKEARRDGRRAAGRGTWAGDKPLCRHCSTVAIYAQGRQVGEVRDGVFRKTVRGSVHMLRKPRAWAIDMQSLADAEALGAVRVEITDRETGNVYRASIGELRRYGFIFDRGAGRQVALPLNCWTVAHPAEPVAEQLCLFDAQGVAV